MNPYVPAERVLADALVEFDAVEAAFLELRAEGGEAPTNRELGETSIAVIEAARALIYGTTWDVQSARDARDARAVVEANS